MNKVTMGPLSLLYPKPAVLIGTSVNGKANFLVATCVGVVCTDPPMISVSIKPDRYSYTGIKQNGSFSVNIASIDQVEEMDYCGVVSGAKTDKMEICGFNVFYGVLQTPMVEQCPVNIECTVIHFIKLGSHDIFIGRIEQTYVSENCLTDGKADIAKIKPIVYSADPTRDYYSVGDRVGKAFVSGKKLSGTNLHG